MAELPRRRTLDLKRLLLALLLLAPAAARAEIDFVGTWHVLVHYTDDNSSHPDEMRWNDRIWVFEKKGSKLHWTEYPIVVFSDDSGRFERRSTGQYARVIGAWEPNESQLGNIEVGLKINTRGSKKKSLRGSDEEGWRTTSRARAGSASIITYQENWSIEGLSDLPLILQEDMMGSGRSETLEGITRYETTEVEESGDVLGGRYERDGTRHGSFQMRRSGDVGMLEEKSQSEIQAQGMRRGLEASQELRKQARESLEEVLRSSGVQLADEQMDELVTEAIRLYLSGASEEQVVREMRKSLQEKHYAWMPRSAEHDDGVHYRFPFESDTPRKLLLGPRGQAAVGAIGGGGSSRSLRQNELTRETYAFKMPEGSQVVAARAGRVVEAAEGRSVAVLHGDGTFARYWPMGGVAVSASQEVQAGDLLGQTGGVTGPTLRAAPGADPQLDFGVFAADEDGDVRSLPIRFDDGTPEGLLPVTGLFYGGKSGSRSER
jgi:murein DD-endopeptidase MepM/ murein hydrolase activator NlpD